MLFLVQSCLTYPKFQSNKDCFTKFWTVICKSLSKYEIMQKIITKYCADPELPKFASFTQFLETSIFFSKNFSNHPPSFLNLYQHAKNEPN